MIKIRHRYTNELLHVYSGDTLVKADLRFLDLSWANLANADLQGANFGSRGEYGITSLRNADLTNADMREAKFNWDDLSGATLNGTRFSKQLCACCCEYKPREVRLRQR